MAYRTDDSPASQLDLTGKLIIKVKLGSDVRRIPIHNDDITYDELVLMMQRVFRGKLNTSDDVTIKYMDEDGDLITIFDSSDLLFAIQCSRILKLTLFVNGQPEPLEREEAIQIRNELMAIRDRVNVMLDRLHPCGVSQANSPKHAAAASCNEKVNDERKLNAIRPSPVKPVSVTNNKEFDPLSSRKPVEENAQSKVMSSFGLSNEDTARPGTPDSVSSLGSSASASAKSRQLTQQQQQQQQQQQLLQQQQHQRSQQGAAVYTTAANGAFMQYTQGSYHSQQAPSQQTAVQPSVQPQPAVTQQQQQQPPYLSQYGQQYMQQQQQQQQQQAASGSTTQSAYSDQQPGQGFQVYGQAAQQGYSTGQQVAAPAGPPQPMQAAPPQQVPQQQVPQQQVPQQQVPQQQLPQQQIPQQYPGYSTNSSGHMAAPPSQGANPYSRSPVYGQYPRAQAQYPQYQ